MNLNWSNRVIKYVLFVFNLLFVISGIIMIAVGVSVKSYYTDYDIFLNGSYFSLPNLLIAIGSLIFFISFFGCCGAIRESWFMIFIFSILLSLIFIMEFSAGIAGYVLRDKTTSYLTDELLGSMDKYQFNTAKVNPTTTMWDDIQRGFQCCGANKPEDWEKHVTPTPTALTPSSEETTISKASSSSSTTSTISPTPSTTSTIPSAPSTRSDPPSSYPKIYKREAGDAAITKGDLPASCCQSKDGAAGTVVCNLHNTSTAFYYKRGCIEGFGDYLKDHAVTLGGVGLAIAFIQLFGVILACHLTKQLKHGFYST